MRVKRIKLFGNSFHKQDREYKNANKVTAALRRKRDDAGKFNLDLQTTSSSPLLSSEFQERGNAISRLSLSICEQKNTKLSFASISQNYESAQCLEKSLEYQITPLAKQAKSSFGWESF